jgi:hypothetical protein
MKDNMICVDGFTQIKPSGRYVDEIELDEHVDHLIKEGDDDELVFLFSLMGESIHHSTIDAERLNAYIQLNRLKQVVEDLLVNAGWEVHIVDPVKSSEAEDYLHSTGGALQVHQVPFSAEWNTELRLDELCDKSGSIRTKEETLALLRDRIGVDRFDIEELSEEDRGYVLAIMQREELDLEDLHDVEGQELTAGAQTFEWFRDDEEGEQEALDYLTDDSYIWKEAVAAGNTTDGLEEWAEDVIRIDGWAQIIGGYDGLERVAELKDGTWFPYIRTN